MTTHRDLYDFAIIAVPNKTTGRTYLRAYKNAWVPASVDEVSGKVTPARSEKILQVQVGVLEADNRVKMGKKFLERFPLLAGRVWYFLENQLVDEATYFAQRRQQDSSNPQRPLRIGYVLFEGFETLDLMGPVEMWSFVPHVEVHFVSQLGGLITSALHFRTETVPWQVGRYDRWSGDAYARQRPRLRGRSQNLARGDSPSAHRLHGVSPRREDWSLGRAPCYQ